MRSSTRIPSAVLLFALMAPVGFIGSAVMAAPQLQVDVAKVLRIEGVQYLPPNNATRFKIEAANGAYSFSVKNSFRYSQWKTESVKSSDPRFKLIDDIFHGKRIETSLPDSGSIGGYTFSMTVSHDSGEPKKYMNVDRASVGPLFDLAVEIDTGRYHKNRPNSVNDVGLPDGNRLNAEMEQKLSSGQTCNVLLLSPGIKLPGNLAGHQSSGLSGVWEVRKQESDYVIKTRVNAAADIRFPVSNEQERFFDELFRQAGANGGVASSEDEIWNVKVDDGVESQIVVSKELISYFREFDGKLKAFRGGLRKINFNILVRDDGSHKTTPAPGSSGTRYESLELKLDKDRYYGFLSTITTNAPGPGRNMEVEKNYSLGGAFKLDVTLSGVDGFVKTLSFAQEKEIADPTNRFQQYDPPDDHRIDKQPPHPGAPQQLRNAELKLLPNAFCLHRESSLNDFSFRESMTFVAYPQSQSSSASDSILGGLTGVAPSPPWLAGFYSNRRKIAPPHSSRVTMQLQTKFDPN